VPLRQTTTAAQPDSVPQAIRYAANHDADIINLSLGGLRLPTPNTQPCRVAEQAAIYYALRKGALVVASVGNTGRTKNAVEDPAVCLGVVAVGAVDSNGKVAGFSAREPYLTLVAPGVNIPSLGRLPGQAFTGAGTSQATALTSAVAALVWSAHPDLGAYGVAARIIATLDKHRSRPSRSYGYGVLDAYRAVTAGVPADSPNPVFDAAAPFLSRADTLNHPPAKPAPAAHGSGGVLGDYHPGAAVQWLTGQVKLAMVLAGCGLALLVVLAAVGLRRRRQRRRLDQHQPVPVASGQLEPEWRVIAAQSRPHRPLDEEPAPPRPEPR
jgi:subtilisin family serine protease